MLTDGRQLECSKKQHDHLLDLVRLGKLFEIIKWVDDGKPSLVPANGKIRRSLICEAIRYGFHSMVVYLWEKTYQQPYEISELLPLSVGLRDRVSTEIAKYLLKQGLPIGDATPSDVFLTHNDTVVRLALAQGMSVCSPDGFSAALEETGCSKPLAKYYRMYKDEYPDLETEAYLALREFTSTRKVRACAILVWAGVDPLRKPPYDPYDEDDDDESGVSAFDYLTLDEKLPQMLQALRLELSPEIWCDLLRKAVREFKVDHLDYVYQLIENGDAQLQANQDLAGRVFNAAFKNLAGYDFYGRRAKDEEVRLSFCEHLAYLGIPCFVDHGDYYGVRDYRMAAYSVKDTETLTRILWLIYERGDEAQRARLKELVRTPKLQSIIRLYDSQLLRDLGLGPKRELQFKTPAEHRPWFLEDRQHGRAN